MSLASDQEHILDAAILSLIDVQHLYVLIDPALTDPLADGMTCAEVCEGLPRRIIAITALPKDRRPYLLEIGSAATNERALNALLRHGLEEACGLHDTTTRQARSVCAWLVAPQGDLLTLASACAQRASLHDPAGEPITFRYWDPRIAAHLPRLLGIQDWAAHLDALGIETWWAFTRPDHGEVSLIKLPACVGSPVAAINSHPQYRLQPEQWQGLTSLGWANRIASLARRWDLDTPPTHTTLENIARQAQSYRLSDETDMLRYAHCALTLHPRFDTHPQVQQALKRNEPSFATTVQAWSEAFIEELRSGAWLQTANAQQPISVYSQN